MSGIISNYTISPKINNRVCISACGQGNIDSQQQLCISTYTSGDTNDIGFCIKATTTPPLDTASIIQRLTLWLDNLTSNCPFKIVCPTMLSLQSSHIYTNGSMINKVFTNTNSSYTIPDTNQGNFLINNTLTSTTITLPLLTTLSDGYTLSIRNVGSPILTTTLNCSGTNLITLTNLAQATSSTPLVSTIRLLAYSSGSISYWLILGVI